ncbi:MAG: hypothetical protein II350_00160 [Clostridia bacterium]|nr:hypothetical protein [Clostridia bacterium]
MAVTKQDWKNTGKGFANAFKGLGKAVVKTVKTGVDKAGEWAEKDDARQAAAAKEAVCENCEKATEEAEAPVAEEKAE